MSHYEGSSYSGRSNWFHDPLCESRGFKTYTNRDRVSPLTLDENRQHGSRQIVKGTEHILARPDVISLARLHEPIYDRLRRHFTTPLSPDIKSDAEQEIERIFRCRTKALFSVTAISILLGLLLTGALCYIFLMPHCARTNMKQPELWDIEDILVNDLPTGSYISISLPDTVSDTKISNIIHAYQIKNFSTYYNLTQTRKVLSFTYQKHSAPLVAETLGQPNINNKHR